MGVVVEGEINVSKSSSIEYVTAKLFFFAVLMNSFSTGFVSNNKEGFTGGFNIITCDDYANIYTEMGVLNNNVWNKHDVGKASWKQCLISRKEENSVQYGWYWNWPKDKKTIYAYPQIKQGSSPWAPLPHFNESIPTKIDSLTKFKFEYQLDTTSDGAFNTATTLWLTHSAQRDNMVSPDIIAAEVMVWTQATEGHFSPAGRKIDSIEINNQQWEVWYQRNWSDQSGKNNNHWSIVTFKSVENLQFVQLDILALLRYAENYKLIQPQLFVADIELGNEIMRGEGVSWVKYFNVSIEN